MTTRPKVKKCHKCGCENQEDALYCSLCGNKISGRAISHKVAMVAAILVIACAIFVVIKINDSSQVSQSIQIVNKSTSSSSFTCYAYTEIDEYDNPIGGDSGYSITIKLKKLSTPRNVKGMIGEFQYTGTIEIDGHMCWFSGDVVGRQFGSSGDIQVYLSERHENSMHLIDKHNHIMTLNRGHNKITWGERMFDIGLVNASTETTVK